MVSGIIQASPMKLCTVVVLLKAYQNTYRIFQKCDAWHHNDVITKTMENSDLRETRQMIHHLKGINDESFLKM